MSPLFLFTILIPEIIVHDVSFTFIRVKQVKYSLFHGRDRTSSLSKQGSQKVRDFLGRGRSAASQTRMRVSSCKPLPTSGPPMMSKTVLDLLHSLGVEDDMIMFDNFGG